MHGLSGETALLTASSSGPGTASARALDREGANVVVNGRDPDRFEAVLADRMAGIPVDRIGDPLDLGNVVRLPLLPGSAVPERGGHPGRRRRTPLDAVIIPS